MRLAYLVPTIWSTGSVSPATLAQITTEHVLPKFPAIKDILYPLVNGKDIVNGRAGVEILEGHVQCRIQRQSLDGFGSGCFEGDDGVLECLE